MNETRINYGDAGVMRIYISHPQLESAIIVPPTYLGEMSSQTILNQIDKVLYSAGSIPADDELEINAAVVEFLSGSGRLAIIDVDTDINLKRATVKIRNRDKICLPRAIMVGFAHLLSKAYPSDSSTRFTTELEITDVICKGMRQID